MIAIDSNIWCYYFDSSAKEHKKAASYIDSILGRQEIAMNTIILMEISHYLVKNLGPVLGREKIEGLLSYPFIIKDFDYGMFLESVKMLEKYSHSGIGGRDATILALMKSLGIKRIATHDKDFREIDFIEVVDPVGD